MKRILSFVLAALLTASALTGCSGGGASSADAGAGGSAAAGGSSSPIKIAYSGPITGDYAEYGQNFKTAVEVAVKEVNDNGGLLGGRMVEVEIFDDKNSSEEAGAIAEKIVSDKDIVAVFGHFASGVAMTAANTYQEVGIPLLSASASHPDYSGIGDYIFRNNVLISTEVQNNLQIAYNEGKKNIGVLKLKNDWGQGADEQLQKAMAEIEDKVDLRLTHYEEYMDGTVDFSANITNFINADCDAIIVLGMYNAFAPFAKQYKELDPDIQFISVGSAYSQELINLGGDAVNGTMLPAGLNPESENPVVKDFVDKYKEACGKVPDNMAAQTYENVMIVMDAIERCGSADRAKIKDALYETSFDGVTGHIKFDENGDAEKIQILFKIEDGKFVEIENGLKTWNDFKASL